MSLYAFYRSRQWLGGAPALLAVAAFWLTLRGEPLKIQPVYDASAVELALVEPEPEPAPPAPPVPSVEEAPALPVQPVPEAPPPPPKPPTPKPTPKPPVKPVERKPTAPTVAAQPAPHSPVAEQPAVPRTPALPAAPAVPKVDSAALESSYLQSLRGEIERFKQYPSGRQAALEQPNGNVLVWLLVDRAGNVLDAGIDNPAASMLLNRAATSSLKRIKQVKPFPEQAFGGRPQQRFTATFNYSVQ